MRIQEFVTDVMLNDMKKDKTMNTAQIWREPVWCVTPMLRWKKIEYGELNTHMVLQQLWGSDTGEHEWRDVPIED
jgi:hypothetical protein